MLRKRSGKFALALLALTAAAVAMVNQKIPFYSKFDKKLYLDNQKRALIRPGLNAEIEGVEVGGDRSVAVTIRISDDFGQPLDVNGVLTPGAISRSWLLGYIPRDGAHYQSYITRESTSPITGDTAIQPTSERNGAWEEVEPGLYRYTYSTLLPEDHDPDATHTVGVYLRRELEEFDLGRPVANVVQSFVPSGAEIAQIRDVVRTESCNSCHDPLAIHGGSRQEMDLCVMCHYPGVLDPDTGNSVDMAEMTHKIHMGTNLPSVQAGTPYQIIGFRQSVHDYSDVFFPADVRNCGACHKDDAAQAHLALTNPSQRACGSCHDDVNFATGENHVNLPQISDNQCASCHFPEGELEFDASIIGAHTIPAESEQLAGINFEILRVEDAAPGMNPTVHFRVTDNAGALTPPSGFPFLNLVIAGPNIDYNFLASERAVEAAIETPDGYAYTFNTPLPEDAAGSYTVAAEAFRNVPLNAGTVIEFSHRETAENPTFAFSVDGSEPQPRRMSVSDAKCESCHANLAFHGSIRHDTQYCVTCHQPAADDSPFRPEDELPARSIDFKFMIHRIHAGEELTRDYTLFGFMGARVNYNHVVYPGDLRNCDACHVDDSYNVPAAGVEDTPEPYEFFSPMPPSSTSCLGCHDSREAAAHAFVNISPFGEACGSCHGEGADFAVSKVHARNL